MQLEAIDRWVAGRDVDPGTMRAMFDEALSSPLHPDQMDPEQEELMTVLRLGGR